MDEPSDSSADLPPGLRLLAETKLGLDVVATHLAAAEALAPAALLEESELAEDLAELRRDGYNDFRLDVLQRFGRWLESRGEDELLPVAFWEHLAVAAIEMNLQEFVPFFLGKFERRPRRDVYDQLVAAICIAVAAPPEVRAAHPAAMASLDELATWLAALDSDHPALFARADPAELRQRFVAARYMDDEPTATALAERMTAMFADLFPLVAGPDLPPSLADAAWSVINGNSFEMRVSDGSMPSTYAAPWWDR